MFNTHLFSGRVARSNCNYWLRELSLPILISSRTKSRAQLDANNVDNQSTSTMESDCILVEKAPEVIVIEDDDDNVEGGARIAARTQENELTPERQTRGTHKYKTVDRKPPNDFFERIRNPFRKLRYAFSSKPPPTPAIIEALQRGIVVPATPGRRRYSIYKLNTYNTNKEKPPPGKRMVILDGSNIAYAHSGDKFFSVKGVKIALEYFERMGHEVKAVVPQNRLRKSASSDPELLRMLHQSGKIVLTPCKNLMGKSTASYDDRFILQIAVEFDAAVVSNDNFNDLVTESLEFKKVIESRVIGYTWFKDLFMIPKDPYGRNGPSLSAILNRA